MYIYVYVGICMQVFMYECTMRLCMYVCMHVSMYVSMYVHVHTLYINPDKLIPDIYVHNYTCKHMLLSISMVICALHV